MRLLTTAISALLITGGATEKGNNRHAKNPAAQLKMVAVQREARLKEKQAASASNEKLFDSLAAVCQA